MGPYLDDALLVMSRRGPGKSQHLLQQHQIQRGVLSHSFQQLHGGGISVESVRRPLANATESVQKATVQNKEADAAESGNPKPQPRRRRQS
jgi:hypothetical protein